MPEDSYKFLIAGVGGQVSGYLNTGIKYQCDITGPETFHYLFSVVGNPGYEMLQSSGVINQ